MKRHHGNEFAQASLETTLDAVRAKRRRRARTRTAAALSLVAVAAGLFFLRMAIGDPEPALADSPAALGGSPPRAVANSVIRVFRTDSVNARGGTLKVISTDDLAPTVRSLDDMGLSDFLAGRPHGKFTTADGRKQLWMPES